MDGGITFFKAADVALVNLRWASAVQTCCACVLGCLGVRRYAQVRSGPFLGKPNVGDQACRNDQSNKCTSSNSFRAPSSRTMLPCRDPLIANAHARRYF